MTALDRTTHALTAQMRVVAVLTREAYRVAAFLQAVFNRRYMLQLEDLSDHQLEDIGLKRTDLEVVMRKPLGVDPTMELNALSMERAIVRVGGAGVTPVIR